MALTEHRDLRGGRSSWIADDRNTVSSDALPDGPIDIAIVGAGIMGAILAERLSADGHAVTLFDRRPPAHGSTAASTALVMWGADVPLSHLAKRIGFDAAARSWRRIAATVSRLAERIDKLGIDCGRIGRPELYLAGTLLDEAGLRDEEEARRRADLPSEYLKADHIAERFEIAHRAALLSAGSYEVDPVRLTLGLLDVARLRGAKACFPCDIVTIEQSANGIVLTTSEGTKCWRER